MEQYYYQLGGKVLGPYTVENLASLKSAGAITGNTLVCKAGEQDWKHASCVLPSTLGTRVAAASPKPLTATSEMPLPVMICNIVAALSGVVGVVMMLVILGGDTPQNLVSHIVVTVCLSDALIFWLLGCGIRYAFDAADSSRRNANTLNQIQQRLNGMN